MNQPNHSTPDSKRINIKSQTGRRSFIGALIGLIWTAIGGTIAGFAARFVTAPTVNSASSPDWSVIEDFTESLTGNPVKGTVLVNQDAGWAIFNALRSDNLLAKMSTPFSITTLSNWLDERSGVRSLWRGALDEPIRGGARWAYVFGSALAFLFALQVVTGMLLSIYYIPSADHAHASVAFIQKVVRGGALFRGLHAYGASAMIVLLLAHISQTFLYGAYKQKRELVWLVGGLLLLLLLAFAFTGYLLPWDQEAYFATKVGVSIAGEVPVIGPAQRQIMLGGSDLTSLTLSRFFIVHVLLLPILLGVLIVVHVYLFRRAGPAGPTDNRNDRRADRFFPKQLLKDSIAALIIFGALLALAKFFPARLGPEANPTSDFLARPRWYFLPLFELLKYFPGKLSLVPTVVVPGVLFALIFLLPFLDRKTCNTSTNIGPKVRPPRCQD